MGMPGSLQRLENAASAIRGNLVRVSTGLNLLLGQQRRVRGGVADVRAQHVLQLAAFRCQNIDARLQRLQVAHLAGTAVAGVFAVLVAVDVYVGNGVV